MNENNIKSKADYAPNEKKVWRPETAIPVSVDHLKGTKAEMTPAIYFIAIEELQGAWIEDEYGKKVWEEADSSETWTETYVDDEGHEVTRVIQKDIPRSRRYVLKRFTETGFAENAYSRPYNGNRQYQK